MLDVVVVGGGFAGRHRGAREPRSAAPGRSSLEARDRLGGRTWTAPWEGLDIELGGGWVHWHQPHTWSEIVRAGLRGRDRPGDGARRVVRRRRAPHGHHRRARRDRRARLERVRRGRRGGCSRCRTIRSRTSTAWRGSTGMSIAERMRRAGADRRGAGRARRGARVARERPARGVGRRERASLARALGLQPRAHAVHRRAGDARAQGTGALLAAIAGGALVRRPARGAGRGDLAVGVRRRGAPARRRGDHGPRGDRGRAR